MVVRRRKPPPKPKKSKRKAPRVVYEDELGDTGEQVQVPQHPGLIIV